MSKKIKFSISSCSSSSSEDEDDEVKPEKHLPARSTKRVFTLSDEESSEDDIPLSKLLNKSETNQTNDLKIASNESIAVEKPVQESINETILEASPQIKETSESKIDKTVVETGQLGFEDLSNDEFESNTTEESSLNEKKLDISVPGENMTQTFEKIERFLFDEEEKTETEPTNEPVTENQTQTLNDTESKSVIEENLQTMNEHLQSTKIDSENVSIVEFESTTIEESPIVGKDLNFGASGSSPVKTEQFLFEDDDEEEEEDDESSEDDSLKYSSTVSGQCDYSSIDESEDIKSIEDSENIETGDVINVEDLKRTITEEFSKKAYEERYKKSDEYYINTVIENYESDVRVLKEIDTLIETELLSELKRELEDRQNRIIDDFVSKQEEAILMDLVNISAVENLCCEFIIDRLFSDEFNKGWANQLIRSITFACFEEEKAEQRLKEKLFKQEFKKKFETELIEQLLKDIVDNLMKECCERVVLEVRNELLNDIFNDLIEETLPKMIEKDFFEEIFKEMIHVKEPMVSRIPSPEPEEKISEDKSKINLRVRQSNKRPSSNNNDASTSKRVKTYKDLDDIEPCPPVPSKRVAPCNESVREAKSQPVWRRNECSKYELDERLEERCSSPTPSEFDDKEKINKILSRKLNF